MWPAGLHWGNSQSDVSVFSVHLQQQVSTVWSSQSSDFGALHSQRVAIGYIESQTKRVQQPFSCFGLPRSLGTSQRFCLRSLLIYNKDGANSRSEDLLWWGTVWKPWPGLAHSTLTAPLKGHPTTITLISKISKWRSQKSWTTGPSHTVRKRWHPSPRPCTWLDVYMTRIYSIPISNFSLSWESILQKHISAHIFTEYPYLPPTWFYAFM